MRGQSLVEMRWGNEEREKYCPEKNTPACTCGILQNAAVEIQCKPMKWILCTIFNNLWQLCLTSISSLMRREEMKR